MNAQLSSNLRKSGAEVFNVSGVSEDGWCGPVVTFHIGAHGDVSICSLVLWLKERKERNRSHFLIRFSSGDPFEFDIEHETLAHVQIACRCGAGDVLEGEIRCDNVFNIHGDLRTLSFRLIDVEFA